MIFKRIVVIVIVVLAVFACIGGVGAEFDESTESHNFDGIELEIPKGADIHDQTGRDDFESYTVYHITLEDGSELYVSINVPFDSSKSAKEYIQTRAVATGGCYTSDYKDWGVIEYDLHPMGNYELVKWNGEKVIILMSDDLDLMKNIADSYKVSDSNSSIFDIFTFGNSNDSLFDKISGLFT